MVYNDTKLDSPVSYSFKRINQTVYGIVLFSNFTPSGSTGHQILNLEYLTWWGILSTSSCKKFRQPFPPSYSIMPYACHRPTSGEKSRTFVEFFMKLNFQIDYRHHIIHSQDSSTISLHVVSYSHLRSIAST